MSGKNDAHGTQPTVEEEMASFKGFSTLDGETQTGEKAGKPSVREAKATAANAKGSTINDAQKTAAELEEIEEAERVAAAAGGKSQAELEDEKDEGETEETPEEKAEREANETPEEKETREAAEADKAAKDAKHRSAERRIGQATAKQRQAERDLAAEREARAKDRGEFEARLATLEKGGLTGTKGATTKDPLAPNAADFEYGELDGKYISALARYEAKKELADERAQEAAKARTKETAQAQSALETKIAALTEAGVKLFGEDFEEIVESGRNNEWPLPPIVGQLLLDSPEGPAIAKHLYDNPKEGTRISQLAPAAQAAAFGRLEAKFSSGSSDATTRSNASAPVKTSKAPPVPASRARGAGGKNQVSEATTDFKAFEAAAMRRPN
jgi:hypothetical protein